jgi:hypothetical protein
MPWLRLKRAAFAPVLADQDRNWSDSGRRRLVKDYVDIVGASGAVFRFMRLKDGRPLSPMGGNFIFGRYTGDRFELVYAGEVQNLLKDARERWAEAVERFQASEVFTRLNISERVRQLELADIVEANAPLMNSHPDRKAG